MRITNRYIYNSLNKHIQQNLNRVARTQEQLSTGKTMLRPSDKPNNLSQLLTVKASISYLEQYDRNLDDGLSYLNLNDSTMQTLGDILHAAAEMAVQGANGTYSQNDLAALGEQVDKMIDHVIDLANSSVGGRFIYAGTKNSSAPFRREGDRILYSGDLNGIYREVLSGDQYRIDAPGITAGYQVVPVVSSNAVLPKITQRPADLASTGIFIITRTGVDTYTITNPTNLDGVTPAPDLVVDGFAVDGSGNVITINGPNSELAGLQIDMTGTDVGDQFKIVVDNEPGVFGHGEETAPGSGEYVVYDPTVIKDPIDMGIFDILFRLRDSLKAGDYQATGACIGEIRFKTDQLLQRRVGVGSRTRHFEALKDQIVDLELKLKDFQMKLEGADMYKLSIVHSEEQITFQASLASGANIMKVSLLNFLK